jgi:hypothetical protein
MEAGWKPLWAQAEQFTTDRRLRFGEAASKWLEGPVADLRPRTQECYRNAIAQHLVPMLGNHRLDSISAEDLAHLVRKLRARGLSESTIVIVIGVANRESWRDRLVAEYDYVRDPKESGYRAIHLVVMQDDRRIEIQLRTPWQDMWAQSAEEDTARLGLGLKFGLGPDDLREYYRLTAEVITAREEGRLVDEGVISRLAKLHPEMRRYFTHHRHEP